MYIKSGRNARRTANHRARYVFVTIYINDICDPPNTARWSFIKRLAWGAPAHRIARVPAQAPTAATPDHTEPFRLRRMPYLLSSGSNLLTHLNHPTDHYHAHSVCILPSHSIQNKTFLISFLTFLSHCVSVTVSTIKWNCAKTGTHQNCVLPCVLRTRPLVGGRARVVYTRAVRRRRQFHTSTRYNF